MTRAKPTSTTLFSRLVAIGKVEFLSTRWAAVVGCPLGPNRCQAARPSSDTSPTAAMSEMKPPIRKERGRYSKVTRCWPGGSSTARSSAFARSTG
jgi:hypothetical protein